MSINNGRRIVSGYYVNDVYQALLDSAVGETVFIAAIYIVVIVITDILYTIVDPRIRLEGGKH